MNGTNLITLNAEGAAATNLRMSIGTIRLSAAGGVDPDVRKFKLDGYTGGKVSLPGFDLRVVFELRSMWKNDGQLPLLLDHKFSQPVGHSDNIKISDKSIAGIGLTSVPGEWRDTVLRASDNKFRWQLSVGGTCEPEDIELIPEGRNISVNGRSLQGPFYLARRYHLRELSFVSMGADDEGATATLVASLAARGNKMNFAVWLKTQGHDIDKLSANDLAAWRGKYDAAMLTQGDTAGDPPATPPASTTPSATPPANTPAPTPIPPVSTITAPPATVPPVNAPVAGNPGDDFLTRQAAQIEQFRALETLNAQFGNPTIEVNGNRISMLAHAATNRWSAQQFELAALRALRPAAPQPATNNGSEDGMIMQAAFIGAFVARAGINLDHKFFGSPVASDTRSMNAAFKMGVNDNRRQRWMEAAGKFRGLSMIEMVEAVCKAEGVVDLSQHGHFRNNPHWMRAAFSSLAVTDLFTQSMQAVLLATYMEQQSPALDAFISHRDVPNFLLNERPRVLLGGNDFERLLPTATARDITMSTTGESYRIARYAAMIRINEETLTNERFDVIQDQPKALGMAAARIEPELFFALLLANPDMADGDPFFKTSFNKRTSSAITAANLEAAVTQMGIIKENGHTVNVEASHILHSKSKRFAVARILSETPNQGSTATDTSENVLANIVTPVYDARLDNGFTSPEDRTVSIAGEPTSWFLGDSRWPAVEMGHLQGTNRQVQVDSGRMTEGQWGIWFAAKKDAGVAPLRRESIQKNEA